MDLKNEFEVFELNNEQRVLEGSGPFLGELRPTQLGVLAHGSVEDKPSYMVLLQGRDGFYCAQISDKMLREGLERAENLQFEEGYTQALKDFGIWKDGVQRIGCLETPINKIIEERKKRVK